MAYSQIELDALKSAYATGTLRVAYEGKLVMYQNGDDLLRRIRVMEAELAAGTGHVRPVAGFAGFSRGT